MTKQLKWYNTYFWNCPCKCCGSVEACNHVQHNVCQKYLDIYTGRYSYEKFCKLHGQLENDLVLYREALQQIKEDGYKDTDREFAFISSRFTYIEEILHKYF